MIIEGIYWNQIVIYTMNLTLTAMGPVVFSFIEGSSFPGRKTFLQSEKTTNKQNLYYQF